MDNNKHDAQSPESQATPVLAPSVNTDDAAPQTQASEPQVNQLEDKAVKPADTQPQASKSESTQATRQVVQVNRSSWAIRFGVLLALGLTACTLGGGYLLYQQMQQQLQAQIQVQTNKNQALQDQLQQALLAPNQRIAQLEQQQLSNTKTFQELAKLASDQSQLQDRLNKLAQRSPTHWMASEAEYLVNMAGRKLWLEKDPRTATDLLKSADETIAAMNNPALLPIRKALAKDIAATTNIKSADIEGKIGRAHV